MENQPENLNGGKKAAVESMFDSIAWRYDFLNHFLSFNLDRLWRRRAIRIISKSYKTPNILDVATGTADLALAAMKINPLKISGIDISHKMLDIGRAKVEKKGFGEKISLITGDSEKIPFDDNVFDVAMVAFGVRNFSDPLKGLSEMKRVLKQNGKMLILEFSHPHAVPLRQLYAMYSRFGIPFIGRILSLNPTAYRYLPETVAAFPAGNAFLQIMQDTGLVNCRVISLSGGIASIYSGTKPE